MTLISNGTVLWRALVAAEQFEAGGISTRVLSMPTVKPLDTDAVIAAARETGGIEWPGRSGSRDHRVDLGGGWTT